MPSSQPQAIRSYKQAVAAIQASRLDLALHHLLKATQADPGFAEAWYQLGETYNRLRQTQAAKEAFQKAISVDPDYTSAYINLGICHIDLGDYPAAENAFSRAVNLQPDSIPALNNLANLYKAQGKYPLAAQTYRQALAFDPQNPHLLFNLANTLHSQGDIGTALDLYRRSLKSTPHPAAVLNNLGSCYLAQGKLSQAIRSFRQAIKADPNHSTAATNLLDYQYQLCDWRQLKFNQHRGLKSLEKSLRQNLLPSQNPYLNIRWDSDPEHNQAVARAWSQDLKDRLRQPQTHLLPRPDSPTPIIGYVSDGFRDFPTAYNLLSTLIHHRSGPFTIHAYSYSPDHTHPITEQIISAVDRFTDIFSISYLEAAAEITRDQVTIAVDLKGFTQNHRLETFALRPAPLQVSFLGFVGTTGADFVDYLIADPIAVPPALSNYFDESLVHLPHSYFPTSNDPEISSPPSRRAFGLPGNSFILASMNHPYKLEPIMFQVWLQLLKRIPNSVLWQYRVHWEVEANLRGEAQKAGLDPQRLVFATRLPKPDHLARLSLADLALDTRIYNGHTTTCDCLTVDVPVVTLAGTHFASRVSASLLSALGLSELITHSLDDYSNLAFYLATRPQALARIKRKLVHHKTSYPLFNSPRFTKNLEAAYTHMWQRYQTGQKPGPFHIPDPQPLDSSNL